MENFTHVSRIFLKKHMKKWIKLRKGDPLKKLQRWVNSRFAFAAVENFEDYIT